MGKEEVIKEISERIGDRLSKNNVKFIANIDTDLRNAYNEGVRAGKKEFDEQVKMAWLEGFEEGKKAFNVQHAIEKLKEDGWLREHDEYLKNYWSDEGYKKCLSENDSMQQANYGLGFEDGKRDALVKGSYQVGLNDAWEAVRKVTQMTWTYDMVCECFEWGKILREHPGGSGIGIGNYILNHLTINEVLEKIKRYEERQRANSEKELEDGI